MRLICEREGEIERFRAQEYWTIDADFLTAAQAQITAGLTRLDGAKLDKFDLPDEAAAQAAEAKILAATFHVDAIERKQAKRHPYPPFTTSTLQQEASRKLYSPATRTMQVAQRLYEGVDIGGETVGLITYMRTDGVQMAAEAIGAARALIERKYRRALPAAGPPPLQDHGKERPGSPRGHSADRHVPPAPGRGALSRPRAVEALRADLAADDRQPDGERRSRPGGGGHPVRRRQAIGFRATGSVVKFDGFLTLYREDRDDSDEDDGDRLLPNVAEGEAVDRRDVRRSSISPSRRPVIRKPAW